jgi:hypothetical protein
VRAESLVAHELERLGWREADLQQKPNGHAAKVALAARLRQETTLTVEEIAGRLSMGSRNTLNNHLHKWSKMHPNL